MAFALEVGPKVEKDEENLPYESSSMYNSSDNSSTGKPNKTAKSKLGYYNCWSVFLLIIEFIKTFGVICKSGNVDCICVIKILELVEFDITAGISPFVFFFIYQGVRESRNPAP